MLRHLVHGSARARPLYGRTSLISIRQPTLTPYQHSKLLWRSQRPFSHNIARSKDIDPLNTTKSQLLAEASSRLHRFWLHIKWPLTRNNRPLSIDDFSAFASWLVMGNVLWIVLGTTTFGLVTMYSIHTFDKFWNTIAGDSDDKDEEVAPQAKDKSFLSYLAGSILSQGLGMTFIFEKGSVLPELTDGMLKFRNLKVVSSGKDENLKFLAKIQELNVTLSFRQWYEGNGLIDDMEIYGMHAKVYKKDEVNAPIDEESVAEEDTLSSFAMSMSKYDTSNIQNDLHEHNEAELKKVRQRKTAFISPNYILGHLKVHDSFLEIYEDHDTTPFRVTIFNCDLPRLRGDRLLVDFFNASNVTGAVNNSMFTIHKHQSFSDENVVRFKLDSIDMESISKASPHSKFNWIVSGKAEILADIRLPELDKDKEEGGLLPSASFFSQLWTELKTATSTPQESTEGEPNNHNLLKGAIAAIYETFTKQQDMDEDNMRNDNEYVIVNVKVKFRNLKAAMPQHLPMASSSSLPFVTLQKLRAMIGYVNNLEKGDDDCILIKTTVIEKLADLYNLDNITQTRIFDAIVSDIYDDFLKMIKMDEKRILEENANSWSHAVASQLLLLGLGVLA